MYSADISFFRVFTEFVEKNKTILITWQAVKQQLEQFFAKKDKKPNNLEWNYEITFKMADDSETKHLAKLS